MCLGRNPYDIPVSIYNGELVPKLSTDFLNQINNRTISKVFVSSYDQGYDDVREGRSKGLISIGANFTKALIERAVDMVGVDDETLRMAKIDVHLDMSCE